jgi:PAS domain S-box-containing protein
MALRVGLAAALLNIVVLSLVGLSLYRSHAEFEEHAETTAQNLAQMLAQGIAGDIEKIDLALTSGADEIQRRLDAGNLATAGLNQFLGRLQGRVPEIYGLRATDADGFVRYGLGIDSKNSPNNSDREYFTRQRDDAGAGLVVTKPVLARIDQRWVLPISRAVRSRDGTFAGVIYANYALDRLHQAFAKLDVGQQGSVSLRDSELRIFARHPFPKNPEHVMGEPLEVPELRDFIRSGNEAGSYTSINSVDGVERHYAVRRIAHYPLYAVVGRSTDETLRRWRSEAVATTALAGLFVLATGVAAWLILRNWSGQLAATQDLAREEEKFHTVADYTYDWEYWESPERRVIFMSPSCERVTGYPAGEFLADPGLLDRIVHPDDLPLMAAHRERCGSGRETTLDFRIVRRDGEIRWIAHGCRSVFGRDGAFMGRRVSNRDITERKHAESAVRRLNAELEQRVEQRTAQLEATTRELLDFSYSISHNLRTPLRAITGFSQILAEERAGSLDAEGLRLLEVIRANTLRMGQHIDDLLEFLRLGRRPIELAEVDTAALVHDIFTTQRDATPERDLRLEARELPPLWGDPRMLRQLFTHLIGNAIKFSTPRQPAVIEVGCSVGATEAECYVRDNGVGFDMKYADKLFKVFEHIQPDGRLEGIGTGLAMARRIVTRHGGRIWAEGKPDAGTIIHFTLPLKEAQHDHGEQ